jgi:hypothetical protein
MGRAAAKQFVVAPFWRTLMGIPESEYRKLAQACGSLMPYINGVCDLIGDDQLTVTTATITDLTATTLTAPTVAAEHGAGAIGTAGAPVTSRRTVNGEIITEIKIDLTGLKSKDTANDVIGLSAGGAAYIGRNVVENNGVIYKIEMCCLETPVGGDDDINLVANSSDDKGYNDAGGTTYGINGGDWTAGMTVQNLVQGLTDEDYFYLTAGTGNLDVVYSAGQFIIRLYGHALLT